MTLSNLAIFHYLQKGSFNEFFEQLLPILPTTSKHGRFVAILILVSNLFLVFGNKKQRKTHFDRIRF